MCVFQYNRQSEAARRKVEYEAKQIQDTFEQTLGTHEQISQRQDARLQRIRTLETQIVQQQSRLQVKFVNLPATGRQASEDTDSRNTDCAAAEQTTGKVCKSPSDRTPGYRGYGL